MVILLLFPAHKSKLNIVNFKESKLTWAYFKEVFVRVIWGPLDLANSISWQKQWSYRLQVILFGKVK